jgi:hypothetical protein
MYITLFIILAPACWLACQIWIYITATASDMEDAPIIWKLEVTFAVIVQYQWKLEVTFAVIIQYQWLCNCLYKLFSVLLYYVLLYY